MNKKGFTLVELLATIIILAVVSLIGTVGVQAILNKIKENLYETKQKMIVESAILYGQDNPDIIGTCIETGLPTGVIRCKKICVDYLFTSVNYIKTEEKCKLGTTEYDCLKNDISGESINKNSVIIYANNNRIYAKYMESSCE